MYGYNEFIPLTKNEILKRASQEEIFSLVFEELPVTDVYITSPLRREDKNPGCWFSWYNGVLFFYDFGDNRHHRDCFQMVKEFYNLKDYQTTLQFINHTFDLGIGSTLQDVSPVKYTPPKTYKKVEKKESTDIYYKAKPFTTKDKEFWKPYGISRNNLIEDNIFSVRWYRFYSFRKSQWYVIRPEDECYAIAEFSPKVKIYRPNSTNPKGKWITNCSSDDIGGLHKLQQNNSQLTITKSYKDWRVLINKGVNCVWFQNEKVIPSNLESLVRGFNEVIVFYDNDPSGITGSSNLSEEINSIVPNLARPLHLPMELKGQQITDSSDLVKIKGESKLIKFLKQKKIKT